MAEVTLRQAVNPFAASEDFYIRGSPDDIREQVDAIVYNLDPGRSYIYHCGFLPVDRSLSENLNLYAARFLYHGTPPEFWYGVGGHFAGSGLGFVTQRRCDDNVYLYAFIRRKRPLIKGRDF